MPVPRWCRPVGFLLALLPWSLKAEEAAPQPGTLVELQDTAYGSVQHWKAQFDQTSRKDLAGAAPELRAFGPQAIFRLAIKHYLSERIPSLGLKYASVDSHGNPRIYSGRLFLPSRKIGSGPTRLPLVIYQHGTETQRKATPYFNAGSETMLGALGAETGGLAVAMPDGDGMGADPSPERHAYCHEATTARCLLDLARAIEHSRDRIFDGINYVWDGRLFIMGYSEGGYIAMAAVKALTTDPACADLKLDGAACMGAPFDLPRMVRSLLRADAKPYSRPYIPTYLLATWPGIYPGVYRFEDAINPLLLGTEPARPGSPDHESVLQWMDGQLKGDDITTRIQARLTGHPKREIKARQVLDEGWVQAQVDPEQTPLNQLLAANNLVGGWAPKVPVLLAHDPFDECVGSYNSQEMFDSWLALGAHPQAVVPLAVGGRGAGHVGGAILSVPMAFAWLGKGMPRSLAVLGTDLIKDQALGLIHEDLPGLVSRAAQVATQEQNANRAEFPLSRIHCHPAGLAGPGTVTLTDRLWSLGKVKLYTLTAFPQFPGQHPLSGHTTYTKFVGQLKSRGDAFTLPADEDCYMAVYPEKGAVALTLAFEAQGQSSGSLNIKQAKNKIFRSSAPSFQGDEAFLRTHLHPASYENPASRIPFITF